MQVVFLAYANDRTQPLAALKAEDEQVYSLLAERSQKGHFQIHRDSFTSIKSIIEHLQGFKEELILFSFSGHADGDIVKLEDRIAHLYPLLAQCPKLKVVILNACSTVGQVKQLVDLPNKPIVIATHAEVNDRSASQFAISFFRALREQETVQTAFELGLAAAQVGNNSIQVSRGLVLENTSLDKQPLWGLYPENAPSLSWKLPTEIDAVVERRESIRWLKWWGGSVLLLIFLVLLPIVLYLIDIKIPSFYYLSVLIFYFIPYWLSTKITLSKQRIFQLIIPHIILFCFVVFLPIDNNSLTNMILPILGIGLYFLILPRVNRKVV